MGTSKDSVSSWLVCGAFALTFDGNRMHHTPTNYRYAHAGFEATWANPQTKNHFVNRFLHYYLNVVNKYGDTKYLFEAKTNRNGWQLYYLRKVTGVRTGLKAKGYTVNAEGYMSRLTKEIPFWVSSQSLEIKPSAEPMKASSHSSTV